MYRSDGVFNIICSNETTSVATSIDWISIQIKSVLPGTESVYLIITNVLTGNEISIIII